MDTHNILELLALIVSLLSLIIAIYTYHKHGQKELEDRIAKLEIFKAQYQEKIDNMRGVVEQHQKVCEDLDSIYRA